MSNYKTKALDIETETIVDISCYDDYFGKHQYGYKVDGEDKVMAEDECDERYKLIGTI